MPCPLFECVITLLSNIITLIAVSTSYKKIEFCTIEELYKQNKLRILKGEQSCTHKKKCVCDRKSDQRKQRGVRRSQTHVLCLGEHAEVIDPDVTTAVVMAVLSNRRLASGQRGGLNIESEVKRLWARMAISTEITKV
ncbi:hypothetical protein EVAR_38364_1 [Eumeta japonica]|uniref:Uncharacterized protein n=1 Tax=Eumeta variegata TaxID=151549 RepID=A0A4C1XWJ3_EUMVA|nr:hypothetical protein EVAR_38364_1 [Eumeta japonica]